MEFVEDWHIVQTLGEGAFGEVKLLTHRVTQEPVAVKIIDLIKHKDAADSVKKEVIIHKMLTHPNVIRYLGMRQEETKNYIFLEFAAGGELFNKIEPDIGMPEGQAQFYMLQLLNGVDYLHKKGIAHRDLKPENILLDSAGNLKISDFGFATIFRFKGKERVLDKRCGTLPYLAPEILAGTYKAVPADTWSCGIILVAMLTGELPWDEPHSRCLEYYAWKHDDYLVLTPWTKLNNSTLSLSRKILAPNPHNRPSIETILNHPWLQKHFPRKDLDETDGQTDNFKRQTSLSESRSNFTPPMVALTQPLPQTVQSSPRRLMKLVESRDPVKCFSQPTQNEDLLIGSQMQLSSGDKGKFACLIKRMTRFFVTTDCEKTISTLCQVLEQCHYTWNVDVSGVITISTVDNRKMQLVFKANLIEMDGKVLLDFRLSKGCGLEFKRRFLQLKSKLNDIVLEDDPCPQ